MLCSDNRLFLLKDVLRRPKNGVSSACGGVFAGPFRACGNFFSFCKPLVIIGVAHVGWIFLKKYFAGMENGCIFALAFDGERAWRERLPEASDN